MGNMHPIFLVSFLVVQLLWLPIGSIGQPQGGAVPVTRLQLPLGASFPDTTAFNQAGRGPFTGISDGRILEYVNSSVGYVEFAIASPKRPKIICNGSITNPILQPICGRPLGLAFNHRTGQLFVVDTALGLAVVSPDGGNGTLLVTSAGGVGFKFLNGVDIDQDSEVVYFTDTSSKFTLSDIIKVLLTRDKTGRLLSYNPRTNESRVLLTGLAGPNGVAVSRDGSFLLFTEMVTNTIRRFWVTGPKANTTELFAQVEGLPDNIRINARGEVWVATTVNALLPTAVPVGLKFSEEGVLQQNTTFDIKFGSSLLLSDVNTFEGQLQGVAPVTRLQLPPKAIGPEALAFNQAGRGPFVGRMDHSLIHVNYIDLCYCRNQNRQNSDGRILEYVNGSVGFVEFVVTSCFRPKIICNGSDNPSLEPVFVGLDGRNPNLVASSAEGVRFTFLNGLDIDQNSEVVFFADTSSVFPRSQANAVVLTRDMTGRLLSYNPRTKELKVLLRGLAGPNGVAVSRGGSFLFFTEIVTMTIQ
ncbi:hypothetical protein CDL15_Pgr014638 [Punica granatum]|uniref:Strictosidine synthase conserved region domain-containing protein n=1 Tax=Punica granatum TaxID=22663 RepID=A0A218Y0D8_PUNGR|nr:hypothetical protein CDL15_Pgr014638 [Punica granatum]